MPDEKIETEQKLRDYSFALCMVESDSAKKFCLLALMNRYDSKMGNISLNGTKFGYTRICL